MEKIKKTINKLFFLIYLKYLFKPYDKQFDAEEIVIIGRGESAKYYFEKFKSSPDVIALVNFTDRDLRDIDLCILENKEIHLFFNIEGLTLSLKYLLKLNIKGIMRTSNEENTLIEKQKYEKLNKFQKMYLSKLPKFPTHLKKYTYLNNSGLLSIVYMIDTFKPKKVFLFGFNFYHGDMIQKYSSQELLLYEKELPHLRKVSKTLIQNFLELCNDFQNIDFYHFDNIKIEKLTNLIQVNINEKNNKDF
jgi:hypothetical protein